MLDDPKTLAAVDREWVGRASPTAPRILAGGHPCQGLYVTPKAGPRPKVAFIASHYNVDFTEHYFAPYLAARGFGFLGWNTRYRGFEDQFQLEQALIDISVGVKWLKEEAGVEEVVILGNSGGGSLMGAYQAEATSPSLAGGQDGPAREALQALPKGSHYVAFNAHLGRPEAMANLLDPAVTDEFDPVASNPELSMYGDRNTPPYRPEFVSRYQSAQQARSQRITDWCKRELARLNAAGIPDRLFPLYRTWADLRFMDETLDPSPRRPRTCLRGDPARANHLPGLGRFLYCRTWLSMFSLEASHCLAEPHLRKLDVPSLVVQGVADVGVFPSETRRIFEAIGAADKEQELIPGEHYFEDGPDARLRAADVVVEWLRKRL